MGASFARMIGPALGGSLFAWSVNNGMNLFPFNQYFIFCFIELVNVVLLVQSFWMLPDELNRGFD
jgi:hypothetical protein